MYFLHIKIYGKSLDSEKFSKAFGFDFNSTSKHDGSGGVCLSYSEDADSIEKFNDLIKNISERLYSKRERINELLESKSDLELYLVLTPYIDNYQTIMVLNNDIIDKISKVGFNIVVDIMNV